MSYYCTSCHSEIDGEGHFINRKRVCDDCYAILKGLQPAAIKEKAKENDKNKGELFSFILSLFPIGEMPDSWCASIDSMLKKKFSVIGIRNTLSYIRSQTDKKLTEENWISLVYIYYYEAQKYVEALRDIAEQNAKIELKKETRFYISRDTTKRDTPPYNMEDL